MKKHTVGLLIVMALVSFSAYLGEDDDNNTVEWEVWLSDQSDSGGITAENPSGTYGSRIVIYEGSDIAAAPPGTYYEADTSFGPVVIEAKDVFPNALSELGVHVRRLHGMLPDPPSNRFMNLNFFGPGTGLVGIIDAEGQCVDTAEGHRRCDRISAEPERAVLLAKALFRTTGPEGSSPSNHMSYWSPDGTKIIIANLGAKLLERIDYDQSTGTLTFNRAATLDLVGGRDLRYQPAMADATLPAGRVSGEYTSPQTTLTPSGVPKEGPGRPNNVVVCPIVTNKHTYVTFGGGGLFVVDITTEPMAIVAEYTNDVISGAGCGGIRGGDFMYLNAGVSASPAGADDSIFLMYQLPVDYPDGTNPSTVANEPRPVEFYREKSLDITDETQLANRRDAHGMTISPSEQFLYQFDRIQNNAEVFDVTKIINDPSLSASEQHAAHVGTTDLTGSGYCEGEGEPFLNQDGEGYQHSDDPAPDLVDITPDGRQIIVSFRGPNPITVKHAALGSCPGFGVVTLEGDGSTGRLTHVFRTFFSDHTGTRNLSDIHAAIVRRKRSTPPVDTAVDENAEIPTSGMLLRSYPNPFQNTVNIQFEVRERTQVHLEVMDLLGRKIVTLVEEPVNEGTHEVIFNAEGLPSGVYLARLTIDSIAQTSQIVLRR